MWRKEQPPSGLFQKGAVKVFCLLILAIWKSDSRLLQPISSAQITSDHKNKNDAGKKRPPSVQGGFPKRLYDLSVTKFHGGATNADDQPLSKLDLVAGPDLEPPLGGGGGGEKRRRFVAAGQLNGRPLYRERAAAGGGGGGGGGEGGAEAAAAGGGDPPLYLYWTGSQWMLNYDEDPSLNIMNCIAYSKADVADPRAASPWFVRDGPRRWRPAPALALVARGAPTPGALAGAEAGGEGSKRAAALREGKAELKARDADTLRALTPIFVTFVLDSISTGMVLPLLPFFIMSQGASPFQLGLVVALTYAAQTLGCLALGKFSDRRGRRPAMLACAAGSIFAYYGVASSRSLAQVALVRMGGGLLGALVPLSQAAIADRCPVDLRTKYIGVLQASAGAGFVVGPIIGLFLQKVLGLSQRAVFKTASLVAVTGTAYASLRLKESRPPAAAAAAATTGTAAIKVDDGGAGGGGRAVVPFPVLLLTGNGFLLMYAFAVETVYAAFLKDNFGYGESVLATLFVLNGMSVGMLQVFFIKKLVNKLGKHMLLVLGNALLAAGMVGLALIRQPLVHFAMFSVHILGYAIADTALSSLISRYSSPDTQGTHLGLNQAVQSFARMISPLVAGALYQRSKRAGALPVGALPYLAGAAAPLLAVLPPFFLYARSVNRKIKDSSLEELSVVHKFLKNQVFDTFEKEDSSGGNSTINLKRNRGAGTGDDDDW